MRIIDCVFFEFGPLLLASWNLFVLVCPVSLLVFFIVPTSLAAPGIHAFMIETEVPTSECVETQVETVPGGDNSDAYDGNQSSQVFSQQGINLSASVALPSAQSELGGSGGPGGSGGSENVSAVNEGRPEVAADQEPQQGVTSPSSKPPKVIAPQPGVQPASGRPDTVSSGSNGEHMGDDVNGNHGKHSDSNPIIDPLSSSSSPLPIPLPLPPSATSSSMPFNNLVGSSVVPRQQVLIVPVPGYAGNLSVHPLQSPHLRRGKWTSEEEAYSYLLIKSFREGILPLPSGTTLRSFLSRVLNCDPMRISKKFVGGDAIGKQVFRRRR